MVKLKFENVLLPKLKKHNWVEVSNKLDEMFKVGLVLDYDTISTKEYFDEMYQTDTNSKSVYSLISYFLLGDWEDGWSINYTQFEIDNFVNWVKNFQNNLEVSK